MAKHDVSWCTIESDPGVFTELIQDIGVKDVQVEELYTLEDPELLAQIKPVYGLIFLFKWRAGEKDSRPTVEDYDFFFASQVINNACATQAILSVLLNLDGTGVDIGPELAKFKEYSMPLTPELRGLSLNNCDGVKKAHNSFARPDPFVMETKTATEDDDVYHFISYLPIQGQLYELDGLKPGPICHGPVKGADWLETAKPVIQKRIEKYSSSEIRFNLMAIMKSRKRIYADEIEKLDAMNAVIKRKLGLPTDMEIDKPSAPTPAAAATATAPTSAAAAALPAPSPAASPAPSASSASSASPQSLFPSIELMQPEQLRVLLANNETQIGQLKAKIEAEDERQRNWKVENIRRKHNYIPFLVNLLKVLAEKGELVPLLNKAKEKKAAAGTKKKE